ncbi:HS12A-like protein [Mya arenaria]|uniref:HS12A-like protein n=1 Tax=Mya arenaria TaxID=6604 RepID=A0ABY7DX72_MYAAR|nr:HS12A-like protein [Mya arenaria]
MDKKYRDDLNRKRMVKQATRKCPESDDEETYVRQPDWANRERPSTYQGGSGFPVIPKRNDKERSAFLMPPKRSSYQLLDQEEAEGPMEARSHPKSDANKGDQLTNSQMEKKEEDVRSFEFLLGEMTRETCFHGLQVLGDHHANSLTKKQKDIWRLEVILREMPIRVRYQGLPVVFPLQINANEWRNVHQGQMKCKTPTCLLLNADRSLNSFGHEAKLQYKEICLDEKEDEYYFFWNFKMTLHQQKEIKGDFNIKAENGDSIDALTAGLPENHIEIALEPEAASLYCRQLPIAKDPQTEHGVSKLPVESQYMILDCGGGTVDVTVHEVLSNGRLKELYAATGGKWGGMVVDKKFLSFIAELVGDQVFESFVKDNKDDYFDLLDDFESKKRVANPGSTSTITIKIPTTLQEQFRRFFNCDHGKKDVKARYKNKVMFKGDKLRIDAKQFNSFFDEAVGDTVAHVHDLIESLSDINIKTIIMVGGFSESPVLQNAIRAAFGRDREIIIPQDASLCVMKGAVLFGHQPSMIAERKARFTFGFAMVKHFNRFKHPEEKKIEINGEELCNDLFDKHIEIGATVKYGETQAEKFYYPMSPKDTVFPVAIFRSTDPNPKFVDERSCDCVGSFLAKRPTESIGSMDQIRIRLILGNSDISVETVKCDGSVEKSDFKINET